jgi:hypothetical protein
MGAVGVVVRDVLGEQGFEMAPAEDDHPVEALVAEGADYALADRVGPECADGALDDPDAVASKPKLL